MPSRLAHPRRASRPRAAPGLRRTPARRRAQIDAHWAQRLRLLRRIKALHADAPAGLFPEALRLLAEFFGLDVGVVSSVRDDRYRIHAHYAADGPDLTGTSLPLAETYCALTLAEGDVVALPHVATSVLATHCAYAQTGYEAYLGVPISVDDETGGTLCLVGYAPRAEGFTEADAELMRLLSHWVGARLRTERMLADLRQSEERFRVLASSTFEAILLSEGGVVFEANEGALALFGHPHIDEFRGAGLAQLVHAEDLALVRTMALGQKETLYEARLRRHDGTAFLAEIQGRPIPYEGRTVRVTAVRDVSEERAREQRLQFHADVLAQVHDAVIATDRAGQIVFWNDGARRLTGYDEAKMIGQRLVDALRYDWMTDDAAQAARAALNGTGQWHGEVFLHTRYGIRCAELTSTRRTAERFDGLIVVARDVTERYAAQQELLRQARQDALTGQLNRSAFVQCLDERHHAFRLGGTPYAVVFLDLNGFKEVNDTYGHAAGDALLAETGARLKRVVRATDAVARLGGDEFAVLLDLPDGDEGAEEARRRIARTLSLPMAFGTVSLEPSASIGVALARPEHADADAVLREADAAMYEAKRTRRSVAPFRSVAVQPPPSGSLLPEGDMVLYAQPIVSLDEGALCGFEVLVRWQHPTRGLLGPGAFLPALLASDTMPAFDARVIARAAAWASTLNSTLATPLPTYVNLSRRGLLDPEMPARISRTLAAVGLAPERLVVELTEQMHESAEDLDAVERLAETGVQLCLDDFGAGHTSVALTEALPLDVLKVDRRLVGRLGAHSPIERMLEGVIGMAHARHIAVVAEGIETPEHLLRARMLGFDRAQGFLLSYPLPLDAAADLAAEPLPWAHLWAEDPMPG